MQLLLPPSETKRSGGGSAFSPDSLPHHPQLGAARARIRASLERLSADEDAAAAALGLGAKSRGEIAHNLVLDSSGSLPAIERYTGVLYDALDVPSLESAARSWLDTHALVQSALFGQIRAADPIPAYRLSAGTSLPGLGGSLKRLWREAHADLDWPALGWVLDLRSKDYVELAPIPTGAGHYLHVAQRGPNGRVKALNHFNKAAKGDLVRRLAIAHAEISDADALVAWASGAGLEIVRGPREDELTLVTELVSAAAARAKAGEAVKSVRVTDPESAR